jgi:hypothetical protein
MKVKELIEELGNFDPEMEVVVDGYETGYDLVREAYPVKIFIPANDSKKKSWYDGDYREAGSGVGIWPEHPINHSTGEQIPGKVVEVVYIPRNS